MQMADIAGAEKKFRQAKFFLGHLEHASREMTHANPLHGRDPEHLEFYFSACLSAAKSVYYVLDERGGGTFSEIQRHWRAQLSELDRSRFERMMGLRDDDVHLALTAAEPLPKYVKEDPSRYTHIFGYTEVVEEENPDGTKVAGPVLRGVVGLYIEQQGRRIEATDACREFITELGSLLDEMKAASRPDETGESKA